MTMSKKRIRSKLPGTSQSRDLWKKIRPWLPVVVPALVLFAALWIYRNNFNGDFSGTHEHWGQFGDYLGGLLNPIVGLITLLLLVRTLELQRTELQEQREEIRRQNNILQRQTIEQALFSWIKDYKSQLAAFSYCVDYDEYDGSPREWAHGLPAIRALTWACTNRFALSANEPTQGAVRRIASEATEISELDLSLCLDYCIQNWEGSSREYAEQIEGLLRTLYGLFKWIDSTDLEPLEKFEYAAIVRARLSTSELGMLFLNGLSAKGTKFIRYIHRYALFDNYSTTGNALLDAIRNAPNCRYRRRAYDSTHARALLHYADSVRAGHTAKAGAGSTLDFTTVANLRKANRERRR